MLLLIFGPPAVGKMTVGRDLCGLTGARMFHNHMTIEPLLETFGYGSPQFDRLNAEFRRRVFEEADGAGLDLVFSFVWDLDLPEDLDWVQGTADIFGGDVAFVELRADLDTRLARNRTEARLADKRSKRDLHWSDDNVRDFERYRMATTAPTLADAMLAAHPHLVIDNTELPPADVARRIADWWAGLPERRGSRWQARREDVAAEDVARLLATVPEWFGRQESNAAYVADASRMETWTVRDDGGRVIGVTAVARHFPHVAEIHLTVVDRAHHGEGVGTAMLRAIEENARVDGVRLLEVKTLGPSDPDAGYARTRHFYETAGFLPLEETELWGPDTPCLLMVKPL